MAVTRIRSTPRSLAEESAQIQRRILRANRFRLCPSRVGRAVLILSVPGATWWWLMFGPGAQGDRQD
jgi:hypothetical protein